MLVSLLDIKKHLKLTDKINVDFNVIDDKIVLLKSITGLVVGDTILVQGLIDNESIEVKITAFSNNQIVTVPELDNEAYAQWETAENYSLDDKVRYQRKIYNCIEGHESAEFDHDKWEVISEGTSITVTTNDDWLEDQIKLYSQAVELYCKRIFTKQTYTQTFYYDQYRRNTRDLFTYQYPVVSITSITDKTHNIVIPETEYRLNKPLGKVYHKDTAWFAGSDEIEIVYEAGYEELPEVVTNVIKRLINQDYNKRNLGENLQIGSDIQSLSVAGVMSLSFDTSLYATNRRNKMGELLGSLTNVLDAYRSSRNVIPSPQDIYVE